ncbi:MAG TPA: hypothetical protein VLG09_01785 [Candidatus Saccharimonadales bacterium]|nr:hypothetical protein [Candidatus Saccharimonadales bacterium]
MIKPKSLLIHFISGKDGRVHIIQWPNFPIIGWFLSMVVATVLGSGPAKVGFSNLSLAFLAIWSYLEVTQGLSYFRRALGVIVGMLTVCSLFR